MEIRSGRSKKYCSSIRKYSCSGPTVVKTRLLSLSPSRPRALIGGARERVHRAQQRDLRVERLAGPGGEGGRDAEQRAVRVLEDEGGAGRVPGGVAAGLEGGADAAGGEGGGVGLALDQLFAGEAGQRQAFAAGGLEEGVVLLGGGAGQRLEDVGEVGGALLQRPVLHRRGDRVGGAGVDRLTLLECRLQLLEDVAGQALALHDDGEDVGAEGVVLGQGQVERAEGLPVGAPLRCGHVLLADTGHRSGRPSLGVAPGRRARSVTGLLPFEEPKEPSTDGSKMPLYSGTRIAIVACTGCR